MLRRRSFLACFLPTRMAGCEGRSWYPLARAVFSPALSALIDAFLESCLRVPCLRSFLLGTCAQTTRVVPGAFLFRALNTVRTAGTAPPAGGVTEVSGPGSGQ